MATLAGIGLLGGVRVGWALVMRCGGAEESGRKMRILAGAVNPWMSVRPAHHLGHRLSAQGHDVRLIPPDYVRPYVKSNKNDATPNTRTCAKSQNRAGSSSPKELI